MKKTLIALAVAASAAVSGSAMAWTANGTGGSVDISGTLTPQGLVTPWEVKVGAAVTGLDADIEKGLAIVNVAVDKAIPVLGIRTAQPTPFQGVPGIAPQIDYSGTVDVDNFMEGVTKLHSLEVRNTAGNKIGVLEAEYRAAGAASWKSSSGGEKFRVIAYQAGHGFYGGLAKNTAGLPASPGNLVATVFPEAYKNYTDQGISKWSAPAKEDFADPVATYSAYYGSGIPAGSKIKITLDQAASGDAPIQWKSSLPVTVSYQ
ncbi:hypothetical protein R497_24750 [Salmonella enterica subsp. enterica serovar Havana]|nr:hypothetical protein [Salmonella enterica]EBX0472607.1 hypothetical protein [Salmonella enterica subsp. enterica serovar Havana]ECU7059523.1 hypothetical protein [Salmonella enterica subsp. enterica serovar Havana]EHJ1795082.1 hypothetical protein [Salmonella enterica]HDC2206498.1 hypothetical protein [Salmonella enterica]